MFIRLLIRWGITAVALAVTAFILPGISVQGNGVFAVLVTAAVLGFVNAIIRPILTLLSCGCIVATLGLFMFIINAITLYLSAWVATNWFNAGFVIDGFWPALWGSIIVSIVAWGLSLVLPDTDAELTVLRR